MRTRKNQETICPMCKEKTLNSSRALTSQRACNHPPHPMWTRECPINIQSWPPLQQGQSKCATSATRHLRRHARLAKIRLWPVPGLRCRSKLHQTDVRQPHNEATVFARQLWKVDSFFRRTCVNATPSKASLQWRGSPSLRNGDTMVVTTTCAPWNSNNPSAMISIRRLSARPNGASPTFRESRALPRDTPERPHFPRIILNDRKPQPEDKLHGDGHSNRVDGHTSTCTSQKK